MEGPMNDNNGMRLEKFFHRVVVGISAALIVYAVVLAFTMVYDANVKHAPVGDQAFLDLVAEQNEAEEAFPQMHPVPAFDLPAGEPTNDVTDVNASTHENPEEAAPSPGADLQGQADEPKEPDAAP